jgi:hypothetical protein
MTARVVRDNRAVRAQTCGDAAIWVCPYAEEDGGGVQPVLRFTDATGQSYSLALSRDELIRLRDGAAAILSATPEVIDGWLDDAAETLMEQLARDAVREAGLRCHREAMARPRVDWRKRRRAVKASVVD